MFDNVIRLLAIGQLALIALVIGRGRAPGIIRGMAVALLLCVCCYLIIAPPAIARPRSFPASLIPLAAQATPLMLWLFAHLLFERPVDRRIAIGAAIVTAGCWLSFVTIGAQDRSIAFWTATVQRSASLGLVAHALIIALRERGDDLIEKRRRLRVGFVVVIGALAAIVLLIEMLFGFRQTNTLIALPQSIAILIATMAVGAALLQSDPDILFEPERPEAHAGPQLTPSEYVLKQKLDAAMAAGIYRETGLTIGALANRLGTPEHRLRALINQRLGYRNFSAFLNHHRIGEAKAVLADRDRVDLPILTMAMDLGYGSLAPFNRAFRESVGQSPSDYRRSAILVE